ncbi:DNA replication and repair protein RecF [Myxococcota bacterium]|nr:DNA replication and repair protein RecF [Myxococcota bacterium]
MRLHHLLLVDFRTYPRLDLALDGDLHVFHGENGSGKTNVLEAIFLLATLKSFRGARNRELIRHGAARSRIEGEVSRGGLRRTYQVTVEGAAGKRARIDGKDPRGLSDYFSGLKAVSFTPDDVAAVTGPPLGRRGLVDRGVFDLDPDYLRLVRAYAQALAQRTELLRAQRPADPAELGVWTDRLADLGGRILERRLSFLRRFTPRFRALHAEITGRPEGAVQLVYRPSVKLPVDGSQGAASLIPALAAGFAARKEEERRRRQTLIGPHRDDLAILLGGTDLRAYGSRGQVRAAALALKLAQLLTIREELAVRPLFLLDDLGSELDPERNERLLHRLRSLDSQVFVTTTDLANVRLPRSAFRAWRVLPGTVAGEDPEA